MKRYWLYIAVWLLVTTGISVRAQVFVTNNSQQNAFIAQLAQRGNKVFSASVNRIEPGQQRVLDLFSWPDERTVTKGYVLVNPANVMGIKSTGYSYLDVTAASKAYQYEISEIQKPEQLAQLVAQLVVVRQDFM